MPHVAAPREQRFEFGAKGVAELGRVGLVAQNWPPACASISAATAGSRDVLVPEPACAAA